MRKLHRIRASRRRRGKPKILICTPEITELPEGMGNAANYIRAKGGGLGDVSAGLIRYLHEDSRFELHVVLPKYDEEIYKLRRISPVQIDLLGSLLHRQGVHLVNDSAFSHLAEIYAEDAEHPRIRRAEAFQRYIINHLLDDLKPDLVHCNDWMTGLVPPAAADKGIRSLFTIHNIFTERQTPQNLDRSGIDVRRYVTRLYFERFPHDTLDTWTHNRIDLMATGIMAADIVNTVSKTFLQELVRGELDTIAPASILHALRQKADQGHAFGIINAPNDTVDPRLCRAILNYDENDVMEKKALNKRAFQERVGLKVDETLPLFFWPSRLYAQKGPELLVALVPKLMTKSPAQLAIVANGDPTYVKALRGAAAQHAGRVVYAGFDEDLSDLARAAADFVLMPSRYEPCGLPQLEGPRFGTLPVVRATGGLKDTVEELEVEALRGNGFMFNDYSLVAFWGAVQRALAFAALPAATRRATTQRVMRESFARFNLANTAREYVALYERLLVT